VSGTRQHETARKELQSEHKNLSLCLEIAKAMGNKEEMQKVVEESKMLTQGRL
jgi:hypothetical protein